MIVDEGGNDEEEKSNAINHCRTTETTHYHKRARALAESKKREFIFTLSEKERNKMTSSFARVNANY